MEQITETNVPKENEEIKDVNECSICINVIDGEKINTICGHKFHVSCYTKYVSRGKTTCPNCRKSLLAPEDMPVQENANQEDAIQGGALNVQNLTAALNNMGIRNPRIININDGRNDVVFRFLDPERMRRIAEARRVEDRIREEDRERARQELEDKINLRLERIPILLARGDVIENKRIFDALQKANELESFGITGDYYEYLKNKFNLYEYRCEKISLSLDHYILFTNYGMKGCSYVGNGDVNVCFAKPVNTSNANIMEYRCKNCITKVRSNIHRYVTLIDNKLQLLPHK